MAKWLIMLYTSLTWWWCLRNTAATGLANETDRLPLIAFKVAIDQDPFEALSSWNDSVRYCNWEGILCSRRHRHRVVELNLRSKGLVGSLSPHIGNLSFLKTIVLQNNSLHGPIPQEIGRLFRLQMVEFSNNSFSGGIPTNLSHCSNLKYLNLIDNKLAGNIPAELGSLSKLGALGLGKNNLSGSIPPSIGNLSSLYKVSFSECNLQGEIPEEISRLQRLGYVQLAINNLSGKIPSRLFNISTIYSLSVTGNQLHGSIPPDIGSTLPNLIILRFMGNLFTGMIPTSLSNASGLQDVGFDANDFTGPTIKDLGKLFNLRRVGFAENRLQDDLTFISSLTNCTSLEIVEVGGNLLRGSLPDSLANLSTYLRVFALADTQIHGSIPSGIGNLLNLTALSMEMNYLTGPIPSSIGRLNKLQLLYLDMNHFTELPSSIGNLTWLSVLHLEQNHIHGSIPPSLGNCHNLLFLDLSHNNHNGSIPPEIMNLSSISISFRLDHNALTGPLPSEVGSLNKLGELDVSQNSLSGSIPNSLSNCLSLERLYLETNSFTGEIPQSLMLRGLRELDLSSNNLSGLIPRYVSELQLDMLNLSFNRLHGEVPMEGVFQNGTAISVVGNSDLCGGIADLNLPPCPSYKSNKNKLTQKMKVIIYVVVALVICLILFLGFFLFLHRQHISKKMSSFLPSIKHQFLRVSYAELLKATNGFSEANQIGIGSHSSVYKGILDQGQMVVVVKVLNLQLRGACRSFMSECNALRSIRHRNLLKILSVCSSVDFQGNEFKALVYEFMANGSLGQWLHQDGVGGHGQSDEPRNLKLIQRLDISIDIASALEYLHCCCDSTIIHGDLKPSNVLLDDGMTAHVGDFGLAKIISAASTEIAQHQSNSVSIRGTIGYVAPEYGMGDMASMLGDVYSFGILLLELFTGKRPTDDMFKDHLNLHNFVKNALPDRVMEVVDPHILLEHHTRNWIKDCMVSIMRIGVACSMESPRDRMETGSVIVELGKIKNTYMNEGLNQD